MAIALYLAMTADELSASSQLPPRIGWMACHFSAYGTGLSNLPPPLPPGSLMILNDRTSVRGHDPELIADVLSRTIEEQKCDALLLDFQKAGCEETEKIILRLLNLPCPVCVSQTYGAQLPCPILLPPVRPHIPLEQHLAPWKGREIWLDIAPTCETLTVTEKGCQFSLAPSQVIPPVSFPEEFLHCHYTVSLDQNSAVFTLCRTESDLHSLLKQAEQLGIRKAVGLYQELGSMPL